MASSFTYNAPSGSLVAGDTYRFTYNWSTAAVSNGINLDFHFSIPEVGVAWCPECTVEHVTKDDYVCQNCRRELYGVEG